jgi:Predicted ATPases
LSRITPKTKGANFMTSKVNAIHFANYGSLPSIDLQNPGGINVVIGENGTGKTFFLKALYSAARTVEEYRRGDDIRAVSDILSEKLRWTFQVDKLGDLVTKGAEKPLSFSMELDGQTFSYSFSSSATSKVGTTANLVAGREANSIFIPAKEVLSLYSVILKSREVDQSFGFDDTYYDLVKALRVSPRQGRNYSAFSNSRKLLKDTIAGKVDIDERSGKWYYKDNNKYRFSIGATSEGIKKISILDRLLSNGYLDKRSVIFIDELESALHPSAICTFLDMIENISDEMGVQFFIATHSYFVIKKLALIAMRKQGLITCISLHKDKAAEIYDLHSGMPENSIIDAAIQLYEQEIEEGL